MNPRGIRNNNPLNIRKGSNWLGLTQQQSDPAFCQFSSMTYGLRAGFKLLRNYITGNVSGGRKVATINDIISRWAPASENNTRAYVKNVAAALNRSPYEIIDYSDRKTMVNLVSAMCKQECGKDIDTQLIETAYDLA